MGGAASSAGGGKAGKEQGPLWVEGLQLPTGGEYTGFAIRVGKGPLQPDQVGSVEYCKDDEGGRSSYSGLWSNGAKEGLGVMEFQDGSSYVGEWLADAMHGKGVLHEKAAGVVFRGEFAQGVRHGLGTETPAAFLDDDDDEVIPVPTRQVLAEGTSEFAALRESTGGSQGGGQTYEGRWEMGQRSGLALIGRLEEGRDPLWEAPNIGRTDVATAEGGEQVASELLDPSIEEHAALLREIMELAPLVTAVQKHARDLGTSVESLRQHAEQLPNRIDPNRYKKAVKEAHQARADFLGTAEVSARVMAVWHEVLGGVEERANAPEEDDGGAQEAYLSYMKELGEAIQAKKQYEREQAALEHARQEREREEREAREAEENAENARNAAKTLQDEALFRSYAANEAQVEADLKKRENDTASKRLTKARKEMPLSEDNLLTMQDKREQALGWRRDSEEALKQSEKKLAGLTKEQNLCEKKVSRINAELSEVSEQLDRVGGGWVGEMTWAKDLEEELDAAEKLDAELAERCEAARQEVAAAKVTLETAIEDLHQAERDLKEAKQREANAKVELKEAEEAKAKIQKEYDSAKEEAEVRKGESQLAANNAADAWEKARIAEENALRERGEAEAAELLEREQSESLERAQLVLQKETTEAISAKGRMSHAGANLWYIPFTRPASSDWTEDSGPILYPTRNAEYTGEGQQGKRNGYGTLTMFSRALPYVRRGQGGIPIDPEEDRKFDEARAEAVVKAYFEGFWEHDVPHGQGVMMDPSGAVYEGEFEHGKRHGFGRVIEANGDKYEGDWVYDQREGKGREELVTGEMYDGDWKESLRWGQGLCEHEDRSVYIGGWVAGVKEGKGKIEGVGYFYEGDFWGGQVHGKGTCTYVSASKDEDEAAEEKEEEDGNMSIADSSDSDDDEEKEGVSKDGQDLQDAVYKGEWLEGKKHGRGNMTYSDGTLYLGAWEDDEPHGYGVMTFKNGDEYNGPFVRGVREGEKGTMDAKDFEGSRGVYLGHWRGDLMHGPGAVKWEDGCRFEGIFVEGARTGQGKMWYANGDVYEGMFSLGQRHGQGVMLFADGSVYEGTYLFDVKSGRGSLKSPNGDLFEGDFAYDQKEGKGRITYADGSVFVGDFVEDEMTGVGVMRFANGDSYQGDWKGGLKDGQGVEKGAEGDEYTGTFKDGLRHGTGKISWVNGSWYDGLWVKGKEDGYGTYMSPEGVSMYQGDWKEGRSKVGKGRFVYPDASCYDGRWEGQLRHGRGTFTKPDGYLYEGEWKNDKPEGVGREISKSGGSDYQGPFRLGKRHGKGCEIFPNGDQYVGTFVEGERMGEGMEFLAQSRERYEGQFAMGVRCGFGKSVMPDPRVENQVLSFEGEWQDGVKHGKGFERVGDGPALQVQYSKGVLVEDDVCEIRQRGQKAGKPHPSDDASAQKAKAIVQILTNISALKNNKEERQASINAVKRLVSDRHNDHKEWRRSILAVGGVKHLVDMLSDDQDDEAQHQAAQVLYQVSQTVDFTGLAEAVVRDKGVSSIISLLTEDASVPRLHACGILNALCKQTSFAAAVAKVGGIGSLVFLLQNRGWNSEQGKVLAAKALDNLFEHQPAAVCSELGVNQAIGGRAADASTTMLAREAVRSCLRGMLAKAGATLKEMPW